MRSFSTKQLYTDERSYEGLCQKQESKQNPEIHKHAWADELRQNRFVLVLQVAPNCFRAKDGAIVAFHSIIPALKLHF